MKNTFTGRAKEIQVLQNALQSNEAEMVSVIGRRRIGKTFLVKYVYKNNVAFELTGTRNAPLNEQLQNFIFSLQLASGRSIIGNPPANWMEAFFMLINYLKKQSTNKRVVVFLMNYPGCPPTVQGF